MLNDIECWTCQVPRLVVLGGVDLQFIKQRNQFVMRGYVNRTELIVAPMWLLILVEDALLLPGKCPYCNRNRSYRVWRANTWVSGKPGILISWEDYSEVSVMDSTKGNINQRCVCCQEFVSLLDGGIVKFLQMIGWGGGWEPLNDGINRYGG